MPRVAYCLALARASSGVQTKCCGSVRGSFTQTEDVDHVVEYAVACDRPSPALPAADGLHLNVNGAGALLSEQVDGLRVAECNGDGIATAVELRRDEILPAMWVQFLSPVAATAKPASLVNSGGEV